MPLQYPNPIACPNFKGAQHIIPKCDPNQPVCLSQSIASLSENTTGRERRSRTASGLSSRASLGIATV